MSEYEFTEDEEWCWPTQRNFKLACCDCGLVHTFDFRTVEGQVEFRVKRDNRATGQIRRHMNKEQDNG